MRTRSEGFTLIELVVVLMLVGISIAVVAPMLRPARTGAAEAADDLARILYRAGRAAAERGRTVRVQLDPESGTYWVRTDATEEADAMPIIHGRFLALPHGARLVSDPGHDLAVFRFDPLGRADGGPVELRDDAGAVAIVAVDAWTGRLHVSAY